MKNILKKRAEAAKPANRYGEHSMHLLKYSFLFLLSLLLMGNITLNAQEKKMTRKEKEAAWRAERLKKRAQEEARELKSDSTEFAQAINAIKAGSWALEASNVTLNNGVTHFVTPSMNFLSVNDGTAVVQTAFDNSNIYSPNGLGGITLEGNVTGEEMRTDSEGNVYYSYNIQGAQISATVNIVVSADGNQATATVDPNFNSRRMTMSGNLYPYNIAGVFEGTTGY